MCYCAATDTRKLAEDFKYQLHKVQPELSDVLVPNCIYRMGCPEFKHCGFFEEVLCELTDSDIFDIDLRYKRYNDYFYKQR